MEVATVLCLSSFKKERKAVLLGGGNCYIFKFLAEFLGICQILLQSVGRTQAPSKDFQVCFSVVA